MLILALMPTAARLAWMIGAMAIMAGKEEAMVIEVSKPSGWPASARSSLAFVGSPSAEELDVGVAPVPLRNHAAEDRRGLAEEGALHQRLAVEREADRLPDLRVVERLRGCCWAGASSSASLPASAPRGSAFDLTFDQSLAGISLLKLTSPDDDGVGQRRDVADDAILHRVEVGLAVLEIVRVALELDRRARLVADEFERARCRPAGR